jgi:GNAT superfamily N-acetyltransferase
MTKQLQFSEFGIISHLVKGMRSDKALIQAVLSGGSKAEVFVDDMRSPNVALLAYNNEAAILGAPQGHKDLGKFISEIQKHRGHRQFFHITCPTQEWRDCLVSGARFRCSERINYRFDRANDFTALPRKNTPKGFALSRIDSELAHLLYQQSDRSFYDYFAAWQSPDEFVRSGLGYCVRRDNEIASIAFACFPITEVLEMGTATKERFRRQGLSSVVSSRLIEDCISRNIEPLWSCYSSNVSSNELAKKLGFEYDHTYYWAYENRFGLWSLFRRIRRLRASL